VQSEGAGDDRPYRSPAALAKDRAILQAAQAVLAHQGWSAVQFARVADDAGLSVQALRTRYVDRIGLAQALWRERLAPALIEALDDLISSASESEPDKASLRLRKALDAFASPGEALRGAVELMVVSTYESAVREAVAQTVETQMSVWLTPIRSGLSRAYAARNAYLIALAFGLVLMSYRLKGDGIDLSHEAARIAPVVAEPGSPGRMPSTQADHLDERAVFATGDPAWDALLQATLDQVGASGFDRATVSSIAHAAGYTEGLIFSRYATKRDLFLDATARMTEPAIRLNQDMQERLAKRHSWGVSDAVMMREFMRPGRERVRTIVLEQYRLASHDPGIQSAVEAGVGPAQEELMQQFGLDDPDQLAPRLHVEAAMGIGVPLLAAVDPDSWELPFEVVTVPLLDK
jgi:AcrR family transcriptional regulator